MNKIILGKTIQDKSYEPIIEVDIERKSLLNVLSEDEEELLLDALVFARDMDGKHYEPIFEDDAIDSLIDKISLYCYTSIAEDKILPFDSEMYKKSKGDLCNG